MKRVAVLLAVFVALAWIGSRITSPPEPMHASAQLSAATGTAQAAPSEPEKFAPAVEPTDAQKKFLTYLTKSGDEPKVRDATWATDSNLYVGVIDDGTRRDGYAEYLCSVAADHGLKPNLIKIIDVFKVARTGKFVELGKAHC